jgi:hypothetical protein
MIGQHDDLHAHLLCIGEYFGPRAAGVRGIFSMGVKDSFEVAKARERRKRLSSALKALGIFVRGFEVNGFQPFGGRILQADCICFGKNG